MLKKIIPIVLSSTIIITSFSFSNTVQAKYNLKINQNSQKFSQTLQNLKNKDPQKPTSQKLETNNKDKNELNSNQSDNLQIKFNLKEKKVNLKNKQKGDISVGIPNSDSFDSVDLVENKIVYSGQNAKFDVIVEAIDGGMRQVVNIKDVNAPDFYDFPVELVAGEKLVVNPDGSAAVIRSKSPKEIENDQKIKEKMPQEALEKIKIPDYSTKLIIAKPWAKDLNGKDLKTNYSIENGNILRQKIELKDAVFPVVADPLWCGNAINSVSWINRNDVWSASNYPTWCGAWYCGGVDWDCWQESYDKTPYHSAWSYPQAYGTNTYWSMYNQFICHTDYARGLKFEWNLEPSKADKGYWGFVYNGCN